MATEAKADPTAEEVPISSDAATPADADTAAAGDAKKPAVRKARVKKPEKPSREELDKQIGEINGKIEANSKRIEEIKALLNSRQQGKQSVEEEVQALRQQLAGKLAESKAVMEQTRVVQQKLVAADEARKRMRDEARALRDRLPYVKVGNAALHMLHCMMW